MFITLSIICMYKVTNKTVKSRLMNRNVILNCYETKYHINVHIWKYKSSLKTQTVYVMYQHVFPHVAFMTSGQICETRVKKKCIYHCQLWLTLWSVCVCQVVFSVTARSAVSVQQRMLPWCPRPSLSRLWKGSRPNYMIHQASNSPYSSQMTFTNYSFLF